MQDWRNGGTSSITISNLITLERQGHIDLLYRRVSKLAGEKKKWKGTACFNYGKN